MLKLKVKRVIRTKKRERERKRAMIRVRNGGKRFMYGWEFKCDSKSHIILKIKVYKFIILKFWVKNDVNLLCVG